jgi:signal transduction histidine kinase
MPHARKKGLSLVCEPGDLPRITCDREKLRQCLINLVNNSVKFTPANGTITVGAEQQGERMALFVRDTGIGISDENQRRIFETFYQVDGSSTREYGGAGLGLAIVKSFVEAHGGEVRVASQPEKGATFTLLLPIRYAAQGTGRAVPASAAVPR